MPNIKGNIGYSYNSSPTTQRWNDDSALYLATYIGNGFYYERISGGNYADISLDASRWNNIYGKSSTVQPPSVTTQYIIKY